MTLHRTPTHRLLLLGVALGLLLAVLVPPGQAHALGQFCAEPLRGVRGVYPETLDNGHPSARADDLDGWNGSPPLVRLRSAIFGIDRIKTGMDLSYDIFDKFADGLPAKAIKVGIGISRTIVQVVLDSLESAELALAHQVASIDDCGAVLGGDFADVIHVTLMEEDLAYLDLDGLSSEDTAPPPPGTRRVPSAMYLLPQDGWPQWQRDAELYTDAPGHADLGINNVDGSLNGAHIGVAVTVRNQIAYLEAAGIDTGQTETVTGPFGQPVTVHGAKDLWMQGVALMGSGDLRGAHTRFAMAYQRAVSQSPPPGASTQPEQSGTGGGSSPPPANPWGF